MRTTLTVAIAAVISLSLLSALEWTAARQLPRGEVIITQIEQPTAPLAQAEVDSQAVRTASSL